MFKEEIRLMKLLSEKYSDDIDIDFGEAKSKDEIDEFEEATGVKLTDELKELYQESNGFDGLMTFMNFWDLETIEENYKAGYNDWIEEGDGNKYIVLGSTGGGEYFLLEISNGHYLRYGDEGEVMPIDSIKDIMCWNIDSLYENVRDYESDEIIEAYLGKNADRL